MAWEIWIYSYHGYVLAGLIMAKAPKQLSDPKLLLENDYFSHSIPLNTSQTQTAGAKKCSCDHAPYVHAPSTNGSLFSVQLALLKQQKCTYLAWHNIINGE